MTEIILTAIAIVMIIEGLGPMLFPRKWQRFLKEVSAQPVEQLQTVGGILVTVGVVSLFFLL